MLLVDVAVVVPLFAAFFLTGAWYVYLRLFPQQRSPVGGPAEDEGLVEGPSPGDVSSPEAGEQHASQESRLLRGLDEDDVVRRAHHITLVEVLQTYRSRGLWAGSVQLGKRGWQVFAFKGTREWQRFRYALHLTPSVALGRLAFALSFAVSCTMFLLIIFEIVGLLSESTRLLLWYLCVYYTLGTSIFFLPFFQSLSLVKSYKNPTHRCRLCIVHMSLAKSIPLALVGLGLYLYAFWRIGDPFPVVKRELC